MDNERTHHIGFKWDVYIWHYRSENSLYSCNIVEGATKMKRMIDYDNSIDIGMVWSSATTFCPVQSNIYQDHHETTMTWVGKKKIAIWMKYLTVYYMAEVLLLDPLVGVRRKIPTNELRKPMRRDALNVRCTMQHRHSGTRLSFDMVRSFML